MKHLLFLILALTLGYQVQAQIQDNSPYSRFGLGDLAGSTLAGNTAMGGISAAYASFYHLNPGNPASYAALSYTAFETGLEAKFSRITAGDATLNKETGNLSHFALGFPIFNPLNRITKKKDYPFDWGAAFGLKPHSSVAYNFATTSYDEVLLDSLNRYSSGEGQRYKLFFGSGFDYKGISVGFNANYLFGKVNRNLFVDFGDDDAYLNDISNTGISTSGWLWDFGVQYKYTLGKLADTEEEAKRRNKTHIIIGATISPSSNVNLNADESFGRTRITYGQYEEVRENISFSYDTIRTSISTEKMKMPGSYSVGLAIQQDKKFTFGLDFSMTSWEQYENPLEPQDLANAWRGAVGIEYTPNSRSLDFLKRVRYRMGAHYGTDPRVINDNQLQHYGLTFGFGLPIRLPRGVPSYVNLNFEVGQQGHPELLQETYFQTKLAFTLNDNSWFYKQKYR